MVNGIVGALFMILIPVAIVCVTVFLSIGAWSGARLREREAFYHFEMIKRVTEASGPGAEAALQIIREQELAAVRKRRDELRLAGPILLAVGIGLFMFLRAVGTSGGSEFVGAIPFLIGIAIIGHLVFTKARS